MLLINTFEIDYKCAFYAQLKRIENYQKRLENSTTPLRPKLKSKLINLTKKPQYLIE